MIHNLDSQSWSSWNIVISDQILEVAAAMQLSGIFPTEWPESQYLKNLMYKIVKQSFSTNNGRLHICSGGIAGEIHAVYISVTYWLI